ncbi:MAG: penicillin acylase family protein [Steroidobacteraceae bacterium]
MAASAIKRWIGRGLLIVVMLLIVAIAAVWWALRGSLPDLDGRIETPRGALSADVRIERDADGAPTIRGRSFADVAYGLGFAHAQDRFFQMDLSRRLAAGELAALLGPTLVGQDKSARVFRLREVAKEVINDSSSEQRNWIEAYTRGVNAGLASLGVRPWEYWLLRQKPTEWLVEDSILVVHAMWWQLQHESIESEMTRRAIGARIEERLRSAAGDGAVDANALRAVQQFLFPRGNEWDAPNFATEVDRQAANGGLAFAAPEVPPPEWLDLRGSRLSEAVANAAFDERARGVPGSNAWAVAGQHTASGAALVAGDMHLGLRVPTVWYRARLIVTDNGGAPIELNGVTLPGLPAVAAGSNGRIAWSFTNSYGDWADVRPLSCSSNRRGYLAPGGETAFEIREARIEIAGAEPEMFEIWESTSGPIIKVDGDAKTGETCWAARWLITERGATNLASLELQQVGDLDAALQLAPRVGIPHQNFTVGDRSGRIAWTIIGRIPEGNRGPETPRPVIWRDADSAPRIVDPEAGRLWSANSRHVEGELEFVLGNDEAEGGMGYDMGTRQGRIRDRLLAIEARATPADMLSIQFDGRAEFLDRWQQLLLGVLDEDALKNHPKRAEMRRWVGEWRGVAAADSVSYRVVRAYRDTTRKAVWSMITESLQTAKGSYPYALFEGSLWRLVTEQPAHMLAANYPDWRSFLLQQADLVIEKLEESCGELSQCAWGQHNTTRIRHPLSAALGPLAPYLDMPSRQLDGDMNVPHVTGPTFGASERFAVSPGRESEAYLQIPGGQSGHPLSPFYQAGFDDWVSGRPRPLLPGPTVHSLNLVAKP